MVPTGLLWLPSLPWAFPMQRRKPSCIYVRIYNYILYIRYNFILGTLYKVWRNETTVVTNVNKSTVITKTSTTWLKGD